MSDDQVEYVSNPRLRTLAKELTILNELLIEKNLPDRVRLFQLREFSASYKRTKNNRNVEDESHLYESSETCGRPEMSDSSSIPENDGNKLPTGVSITKAGKFRARITVDGKEKQVGVFDTAAEASAARAEALISPQQNAAAARAARSARCKAKLEASRALYGDMKMPTGVRMVNGGRFNSRIKIDGKEKQVGTFDTPAEAYHAYKQAHVAHYGAGSQYQHDEGIAMTNDHIEQPTQQHRHSTTCSTRPPMTSPFKRFERTHTEALTPSSRPAAAGTASARTERSLKRLQRSTTHLRQRGTDERRGVL